MIPSPERGALCKVGCNRKVKKKKNMDPHSHPLIKYFGMALKFASFVICLLCYSYVQQIAIKE